VQLHWSTAKYNPWQELGLLNNLCDLKDQGFDFQIGLSNIGPKRLMKLINFLAKRDQHLKSVQIQFSLLAPDLGKQYQVKKFATKIILISLHIVLCPLEYFVLIQIKNKIKKKVLFAMHYLKTIKNQHMNCGGV